MSPASRPRTLERLEARLMLLGWANLQFGFGSNQALFDAMKDAEEGYHPDGRSHVGRMLGSRKQCTVAPGDLARYDDNVRRHLASMNARRREPITLRYFQQLAALYAELFLDRRAAAPEALAEEIHRYVRARGHSVTHVVRRFTPDDLNKLAFWMATGSGKTLIMHLNYLQFLHYGGDEGLDNIILITPNEGLSAQHMAEMEASGISSARFGETGLLAGHRRTVRVTEITKLVERRRGRGTGVSIEVQALGDRNLVFRGPRDTAGRAERPGARSGTPWPHAASPSNTAPPSARRGPRPATTASRSTTESPSSSTIPTATSTATGSGRTSASSTSRDPIRRAS